MQPSHFDLVSQVCFLYNYNFPLGFSFQVPAYKPVGFCP